MKQMWSPWRSKYIETFSRPAKKKKESLFTAALKTGDDDAHFIVWRGKYCFLMMNLYPYNSGHLMIVPYRQTPRFEDLSPEECGEIMAATQRAMKALDKVLRPQGYNFGANVGRAGGAGVDDHIHFHLVPRWNGDTNFMPVLAGTKVISQDMKSMLKWLRKALGKPG